MWGWGLGFKGLRVDRVWGLQDLCDFGVYGVYEAWKLGVVAFTACTL